MKNNTIKKCLLLVFFLSCSLYGQVSTDSWSMSFGGSYPRFVNHSLLFASNVNYGGFMGIQRNFSEHVGLRFEPKVAYMKLGFGNPAQLSSTLSISTNLDFVYYFVPVETVSPYLSFGVAPTLFFLDGQYNSKLDNSYFTYQINAAIGAEWSFNSDWKIKTELQYVTVMDSKFDGTDLVTSGGIIGGPYKSYLSLDIGFVVYFSRGEPSKLNDLYSGLRNVLPEKIDYQKIEDVVKKNTPREIEKPIIVEKIVEKTNKWILVGVNFERNSAKLQPESYPILLNALQTLSQNLEMKIEIQGYTDNTGSAKANLELSDKRANIVRDYLIAQGISSDRLKAVGMGSANPIADNNTPEGRALNRRIVFKVIK